MAAGNGARFTLRGNNYFGFPSNSVKVPPTGVIPPHGRRKKKRHITALRSPRLKLNEINKRINKIPALAEQFMHDE